MAPRGIGAPSAHETQLSNESLVGINPACRTTEVTTVFDPSMGEDTRDADEHLSAEENLGMANLNMDGNYSEDENPGANENPSEADMDVDEMEADLNSDEESSTDKNLSTDNAHDDDTTSYNVSERSRQILEDIEKVRQGVLKADAATKSLKRKAEVNLFAASAAKLMRSDVENMSAERDALETANAKLRCELKLTDDRHFINETNKHLRLDLDEAKAQLRKEVSEKADYHRIKEERTEYHLDLIKKTKECRDLEKKNTELQRKLDMESSFSAQAMAMFSRKPEI